MNKYFPGLLVAGLALTAAIGSYHPQPQSLVLDGGTALETLHERAWVDRTSGTNRDTFNIYAFGRRNQGAFIKADSSYRYHIDLDAYQASADTISFHFLHEDKKATTGYTITRLQPPQDGRDLKLELKDDPILGGSHVYYSSSRQRNVDSPLQALQPFDDQ